MLGKSQWEKNVRYAVVHNGVLKTCTFGNLHCELRNLIFLFPMDSTCDGLHLIASLLLVAFVPSTP